MSALRLVLLLTMAAPSPAVSWAQTSGTAAPGAGLAETGHDFSGRASGAGLCTFCHTPHKALQTLLLWNHTLSTNTFSWDAPATTAGTTLPTFAGDTYRGATAKCLSCHDGSVAVGDVAWWNGGKPSVALDNARHVSSDPVNVGVGGNMAGNHPVVIPYPFQGTASTYNRVTSGAGFVASEWQADPAALNIRLFNDDGFGNITAGAVAARTGIECSSCHDPHNRASTGEYFLRGTLTGRTVAYICVKCHAK